MEGVIRWSKVPATRYPPGTAYLGEVELPAGPAQFRIEPHLRWSQRGPGDANGMVRDGVDLAGNLCPELRDREIHLPTLREAKRYCQRQVDDVFAGRKVRG